jgi:UDP-N-acetyl-D-glucosamine dehydrogenase
VDDDRESPTYALMNLLSERGAELAYYDPFVPVIRPTREHSHWAGLASIPWNQESLSQFDAVVVSTAHPSVNYHELALWAPCIVDARNAMSGIPVAPGQLWKA